MKQAGEGPGCVEYIIGFLVLGAVIMMRILGFERKAIDQVIHEMVETYVELK